MNKNKLTVFFITFLVIEVIACLLGPTFSPYSIETQDLANTLSLPSWSHWMGTDALGRDLFTRLLQGGRLSLAVGLLASLVSVFVGVIYGAISGYVGGKTDQAMMRAIDVIYALPFLFLVIILMVYFGRNILLLFLALGLTQWLTMARIVRGQILSLKEKEFIMAARVIGVPGYRILLRHLIPNTFGPIIVYLTLTIPTVIIEEAFLSFLGLGVQAPKASWGTLIASGVEVMENAPWILFFPAGALCLTLLSLNHLGDRFRDHFDPKGIT